MNHENAYPVVRFLARYGMWVAWGLGALVLAVGFAAFARGNSCWFVPAALVAAAVVVGFVRSYVELVQIISETLLPR